MTLPAMTAHAAPGRPRFTRFSRGPGRAAGYRPTPAQQTGQCRRFGLTAPGGGRAGGVTLKTGPGGRMEIYDLYVEAPHRGKQLSARLMALAARKARQLGGIYLWLEANPNPGEGLDRQKLYSIYEKMGFRKTRVNPRTGRQEMEAPL